VHRQQCSVADALHVANPVFLVIGVCALGVLAAALSRPAFADIFR
jgi:hypothetical protein